MVEATVEIQEPGGFLVPTDGPAAERFGTVVIDAMNMAGVIPIELSGYWGYLEPRLIETFRGDDSFLDAKDGSMSTESVLGVAESLSRQALAMIRGYRRLLGYDKE